MKKDSIPSVHCRFWSTEKKVMSSVWCWAFFLLMVNYTSINGQCPSDMKEYANDCYKLNTTHTNFSNAQISCQQTGGNLAKIDNNETIYFILQTFNQKNEFSQAWIGIRQDEGGSYVNMQNQSQTFLPWINYRDTPSYRCVYLFNTGNFLEHDCSFKYPFLCSRRKDMNTTQMTTTKSVWMTLMTTWKSEATEMITQSTLRPAEKTTQQSTFSTGTTKVATSDQQTTTSEHVVTTSEYLEITSENLAITSENLAITSENQASTPENQATTSEQQTITTEHQPTTTEHQPRTTDASIATTQQHQLTMTNVSVSTTQLSVSMSSSSTSSPGCECPCSRKPNIYDMETLVVRLQSMQNELKVNIAKLSSSIRKKISVPDNRTSSTFMGTVLGLGFIITATLLLVISDLPLLIHHFKYGIHVNCRQCKNKK